MKKLRLTIVFAVGVATGSLATWVQGYRSTQATDTRAPRTSVLLRSAAVRVARDACGDERPGRTVGDVLGGILDAGLHASRNPYSYHCIGSTCRFGSGSCTPWQSTECGATMLEFEVDTNGAPRPETFSCIEVP